MEHPANRRVRRTYKNVANASPELTCSMPSTFPELLSRSISLPSARLLRSSPSSGALAAAAALPPPANPAAELLTPWNLLPPPRQAEQAARDKALKAAAAPATAQQSSSCRPRPIGHATRVERRGGVEEVQNSCREGTAREWRGDGQQPW